MHGENLKLTLSNVVILRNKTCRINFSLE